MMPVELIDDALIFIAMMCGTFQTMSVELIDDIDNDDNSLVLFDIGSFLENTN